MFSIILPSYLGDYPNSAINKPKKLQRAIESVMDQTIPNYELIVIADGCQQTIEIAKEYNCTLLEIPKQPIWSGLVRNTGIENATQDWIIYIDADDYWGREHLQKISDGMCCSYKWFWFDDIIFSGGKWQERSCNIRVKGRCGTSNIVHQRSLPVKWRDGYLHDWYFIQQLNKYDNKKINETEYFVCHIPGHGKSGYDI